MPACPPLPPWHDIYRAAILELDPNKIPTRIERARRSLAERLRQLDPQHPDERSEMDRALNALRMLALLDQTSSAA
jgi:hypothetical protein